MKSVTVKWISALAIGLIMQTSTAWAAEYTWITGGADNNWISLGNWSGTGFPSKAGDIATLSAADTVNLNTNGVLAVARLQLSSATPKTVTLTGDAGATLSLSGLGQHPVATAY